MILMKAIMVILGLAGGMMAYILLAKRAEAKTELVTVDEIMLAESVSELNAWYNLINSLLLTEGISEGEYVELYNAYYTRYNELTGGT